MWSEFSHRLSGRHKLVHPGLDPVQSAASPQPDRHKLILQMKEELLDPRNAAWLADAEELFKFFSGIASRQRDAVARKDSNGNGSSKASTENGGNRCCSSRNAVSRFDIPPLQLIMISPFDESNMSHQLSAGILLGVASAVAANVGVVVEKLARSADASPEARKGREMLRRLIGNPVWVIGFCTIAAGLVMQVLALSLASISVVQAVAPTGTALLLVLSHIFLGDRLRRAEYFGIAALVVALGLFCFRWIRIRTRPPDQPICLHCSPSRFPLFVEACCASLLPAACLGRHSTAGD